MSTSRPFAYNTGTTIDGVGQVGNIVFGTPIVGFKTTGLQWWNGPDEDLGYVIAYPQSSGTQPTPISIPAFVQFWRTKTLTENEFTALSNSVIKTQNFTGSTQARVYLNNNGYWYSFTDPDAQSFIDTAGITGATEKLAVNNLVVDLKGYNIWSKMKAVYPMVGGTATTHKFNLKDPRDLDEAFRLVFNGGWTHSSNGAESNGTNGYANTNINLNSVFSTNYIHQSVYLKNNLNGLIVNGCSVNSTSNRADFGYDTGFVPFHAIGNTQSSVGTDTRTDGFVISFRTGTTTGKFKRNNIDKITSLPTFTSYTTHPYFFGARNNDGSASLFNVQQIAFASIGDGLTDTEAANLYTAVQKYQTTLGRSVGIPIVSDSDAQAFLDAAEITGQTQSFAINNLVTNLKINGLWSKMKSIYPFVGGTATTHKWNLKDPRDLNAAYRLVFNGGWTHTISGATPNGTNGYADTYFSIRTNLTTTSSGVSVYKNNLTNGGTDIGVYIADTECFYNGGDKTSHNAIAYSLFTSPTSYVETNGVGLFITNTLSGTTKGYKNGVVKLTKTTSGFTPVPSIQIGKNTYANIEFSDATYGFISFHDGLTDSEAANLYNIVQTYQTILNRNV